MGREDFPDAKRIYSEFSRTIDKRKGKSHLDERAVETKVLESRERMVDFEGIEGLWESPVERRTPIDKR